VNNVVKNKICCTCKVLKLNSAFGFRANSFTLLRSQCRNCGAAYRRKWYRTKGADQNIRLRYGITGDEKRRLEVLQDYKCAICHKTSHKPLNIDHNHVTGTIRGLLCHNCNRGIGYLHDSIPTLQSAVLYLQQKDET
jgi:Recombination endonuclease VII